MKDIGHLTGRRYFENYAAIYTGAAGAAEFTDRIVAAGVDYLVFTDGIGEDQLAVNPALKQWVEDHTRLVASFGNYRIYRRSPDGRPEIAD
jgi:hypothetical protein